VKEAELVIGKHFSCNSHPGDGSKDPMGMLSYSNILPAIQVLDSSVIQSIGLHDIRVEVLIESHSQVFIKHRNVGPLSCNPTYYIVPHHTSTREDLMVVMDKSRYVSL
jgi:hypothetical protein